MIWSKFEFDLCEFSCIMCTLHVHWSILCLAKIGHFHMDFQTLHIYLYCQNWNKLQNKIYDAIFFPSKPHQAFFMNILCLNTTLLCYMFLHHAKPIFYWVDKPSKCICKNFLDELMGPNTQSYPIWAKSFFPTIIILAISYLCNWWSL